MGVLDIHVEAGDWLYLSVPDARWGRPVVAVSDETRVVPAFTIPRGFRSQVRNEPWVGAVLVPTPPGKPGTHTLTVITDGTVWRADYELHDSWQERWLYPAPLSAWLPGPERPVKSRAFSPGRPDALHRMISWVDFPSDPPGILVWKPSGGFMGLLPGSRLVLYSVWGPPHLRTGLYGWDAPVVLRAILPDGSVGPAWHVDGDLVLADEPEVEDGRYEVFNPDGAVRKANDHAYY